MPFIERKDGSFFKICNDEIEMYPASSIRTAEQIRARQFIKERQPLSSELKNDTEKMMQKGIISLQKGSERILTRRKRT